MELRLGDRILTFAQSRVMGILNVTPDSFSDGGRFLSADAALQQAANMSEQGADIIDVGGESTRPGAEELPVQQELDRILPVIQSITARLDVAVSVDTSKPEVMRAAVAAGAVLINDVFALQAPAPGRRRLRVAMRNRHSSDRHQPSHVSRLSQRISCSLTCYLLCRTASKTLSASTVGPTSCVRTMLAPFDTAITAAATPAATS